MAKRTRVGPGGWPLPDVTFPAKEPAVYVAPAAGPWGSSAYVDTANALGAALRAVPHLGRLHLGDRHVRDRGAMLALFGEPREDRERDVDRFRGWMLMRDEVAEEWYDQTNRTLARETWTLRGLSAASRGEPGSEPDWADLVRLVTSTLRETVTLAVPTCMYVDASAGVTVGHTAYPGRRSRLLCHQAEVVFEVEHLMEPGVVTVPRSRPGAVSDHTARETAARALGQIAGVLAATATEPLHIIAGRQYVRDRGEVLDMVAVEPPGLLRDRQQVRAWQIYPGDEVEERGVGPRVEIATTWILELAWSWRDSEDTYSAVQRQLDATRDVFRACAGLGSTLDTTQAFSSPLQVRGVEPRVMHGRLVHWATCELDIREVLHG